jgi:2-C-methyl-D-erythritol 4-phosphate cytidylyltransferase/2-C-methyl-D-erythritol 2,4-cyclodiphosphate synthase
LNQITALIVAAGSGVRLGGGVPKQYRLLGGKPMLRHAAEAMLGHPRIDKVVAVIGGDQEELAKQVLSGLPVATVRGGSERAESVRNGLDGVGDGIVLVHDAARPFCPADVIDRLLDALANADGAVPVLPVADTLATGDRELRGTMERANLLRVQTPQAFHVDDLRFALDEAGTRLATDESSVMQLAGLKVATVAGSEMLSKITTEDDWNRMEKLLDSRLVSRTGLGFDVHAFEGPGPLVMGGITIDHPQGLAGHSDADVVLHAITDALLGAATEGDIGQHFPPSDPEWKGASSDRFLAHAAELIRRKGGIIDHVDCTVICEVPKVGPHRAAMQARVADVLAVAPSQVSIKATTTERLGFTGRGEGIAAQAVATIRIEPE